MGESDATQVPRTDDSANYPSSFFPVFFADGVQSLAWSRSIIKIYLFRSDPHFMAVGGARQQPVAQLAMPCEGFAAMTVFFDRTLQAMIKDGAITQAAVDQMRSAWEPKGAE